jgi:hypothetical protein
VVRAALDHLLVVDGGELRVDLAGGVGRADQLLAEPGGAGLGDRLALAVGLAGLRRPGGQPGERLEPTRRPEALRSAHRGDQQRRADLGDAGQAAGQLVGLDLAVGPLAGLLVGLLLAKHRAQQPDLGGQLGSQILVGHDGVVAVQGHRSLGNPQPGTRPSLGLDHGEAARRAGEQHLGDPLRPASSSARGSPYCSSTARSPIRTSLVSTSFKVGYNWRARSRMRILWAVACSVSHWQVRTTSSRVPAGAPASAAASITANASSMGRVRRRPRTWSVWSRIATVWAVVMPRSMPSSRRSATTPPSRSGDMMLPTARPVATAPRSSSRPSTAPTHVELTGPASSWV